jgi:uncharacterized phage-associated protein
MVSVDDVAAYILARKGPMSAMKLQKLVYYSQAWSLVWDDAPLFQERIEAWSSGPVCPHLWERHRGQFELTAPWRWGDPERLSADEKATVDAVLDYYADRSAQWLSDLTHAERPWAEARKGLPPGARGSSEITLDTMADYYAGLT